MFGCVKRADIYQNLEPCDKYDFFLPAAKHQNAQPTVQPIRRIKFQMILFRILCVPRAMGIQWN
jgi:hypothetical protein